MQLFNEDFFIVSGATLGSKATAVHTVIPACNKDKPEGKLYLFGYQEQKEWLILSSFLLCLGVERGELGTSQAEANRSQPLPTTTCKTSKNIAVKKISHRL